MVSSQNHAGRPRHHISGGRGHRSGSGAGGSSVSGSHHHRPTRQNHHHNLPYQPNSRSHRSHHRSAYDRSRMNEYNRYKYADEDFESIISPCVKYSLFFFNFMFWVSYPSILRYCSKLMFLSSIH